MVHKFRILVALCSTFVFTTQSAFAQDDGFDFGDDEVEEFGDPMDFGDEEVEEFDENASPAGDGWGEQTVAPTGPDWNTIKTVTGVMMAGEVLAQPLADQLTTVLLSELGKSEGWTLVGNESLLEEFEILGPELAYECAFDPVCLGKYAREMEIARIVIGRVDLTDDGQWGTTLDLYEARTGAIVNYRYFVTEPRTVAVQEAIPEQLLRLFGVRENAERNAGGRTGPSKAQRAMAFTTAGLAVGAVTVGAIFGAKAAKLNKELDDCDLQTVGERSICSITQAEASDDIDQGKSAARISNIMIGSGIMLGVVSTVLFLVTPGSDIDEEEARTKPTFALSPIFGRGATGVQSSLTF